jgi:phosphoserine phosphatase RsbU/P
MPSYADLRSKLTSWGLMPTSKVGVIASYLLVLDLLLFILQKLLGALKSSWGEDLSGWVSFLTLVAGLMFLVLVIRFLRSKILWRLRNRLIVTYVFIGVVPLVMLATLALGSFYLFAGQFATYIVTSDLDSELKSVEASNSAIAHHFAAQIRRGASNSDALLQSLRQDDKSWADRQVSVWLDQELVLDSVPAGQVMPAPNLPSYVKDSFHSVVREQGKLYLRALEVIPIDGSRLKVLSSDPFDQNMLQDLASNLGEVTLYATGLSLSKLDQSQTSPKTDASSERPGAAVTLQKPEGQYVLDTGKSRLPTYSVGAVPTATGSLDREVTFPTTILVVEWDTGDTSSPALINVKTRISKLYERLFAALGELAPLAEFVLLVIAVIFGIIELIALYIGTRLTRSMTGAVAQLYDATKHINRGDFGHRIPIKSDDQIAALASSFNSMTASLQQLIEEQKEKQKLENELAIAQEVQAQLFPREVSQLTSLEVHGFCRPARTVSGDYYDFLTLDSDRMLLAVGDISGKGISAALLMATIHSAVRAYSLQDIPALREPVAVGTGTGVVLASSQAESDVSPAALLALLNHQLYQSTPPEKYATLFLGMYHSPQRSFTYSNGGHLPPIIIGDGRSVRRLDRGGTVVGLFDKVNYEEDEVQLHRGEIFIAYSDGVTEPENDFGEFGEHRLIELVQENRDLPLARISEIVSAAVDNWIGDKEQPDDVTLVLARAR